MCVCVCDENMNLYACVCLFVKQTQFISMGFIMRQVISFRVGHEMLKATTHISYTSLGSFDNSTNKSIYKIYLMFVQRAKFFHFILNLSPKNYR